MGDEYSLLIVVIEGSLRFTGIHLGTGKGGGLALRTNMGSHVLLTLFAATSVVLLEGHPSDVGLRLPIGNGVDLRLLLLLPFLLLLILLLVLLLFKGTPGKGGPPGEIDGLVSRVVAESDAVRLAEAPVLVELAVLVPTCRIAESETDYTY